MQFCVTGSLEPELGDDRIAVGPPFTTTCEGGGFINKFQLAVVQTNLDISNGENQAAFVGYLSGQCIGGLQLESARFTYNNDSSCAATFGTVEGPATTATLGELHELQSDTGFSSIEYRYGNGCRSISTVYSLLAGKRQCLSMVLATYKVAAALHIAGGTCS